MVDTAGIASLNKQASYSTGLNSARSAQKFYREEETASTKQLAEIIARDQITGGNEFGLSAPVIGYPYELDAQGNFLDARGYTIDKMAQLAKEAGVDDSPFAPLKEIQEIFKQNPDMKQGFYISKDPKEAKATHSGRHYGYLFTIERKPKTGEEYISAHAIEMKGSIEELNHIMNLLSAGSDADSIISFTGEEQRSADSVASLILSSYDPDSEALLDEAFENRMQAYLANDLERLQDKQEQDIQELTDFLEQFFQSLPPEEIHDALEFVALYAGGIATALSIVSSDEERGALFQALSELYYSEKSEAVPATEVQSFETPNRTIRLERPSNDIPQIHVGNRIIPLITQVDGTPQSTPVLFAKNNSTEEVLRTGRKNTAIGNFRSLERALTPEVIAVKRKEKQKQFIEAAAFELQKKAHKEAVSKEASNQKQVQEHLLQAQKEALVKQDTQKQRMSLAQEMKREETRISAQEQRAPSLTEKLSSPGLAKGSTIQHAEHQRIPAHAQMKAVDTMSRTQRQGQKEDSPLILEQTHVEARLTSKEIRSKEATISSSMKTPSETVQRTGLSKTSSKVTISTPASEVSIEETLREPSTTSNRIDTVRSIISVLSKSGLSESDIVSKLESRGQPRDRITALLRASQTQTGSNVHLPESQRLASNAGRQEITAHAAERALQNSEELRSESPLRQDSGIISPQKGAQTEESPGSLSGKTDSMGPIKNASLNAEQEERIQKALKSAGVSEKISEEILQSIERSQELLEKQEVRSLRHSTEKTNTEKRLQSILKLQLKELGLSEEVIKAIMSSSPSPRQQSLLEAVEPEAIQAQLKELQKQLQESKPLTLNDALIEVIQKLKKEMKGNTAKESSTESSKEATPDDKQEDVLPEISPLELETEETHFLEIDAASILLQAGCALEEVAEGTRLIESFIALDHTPIHLDPGAHSLRELLKELTERPPENQTALESIIAPYGLSREDTDMVTRLVSKILERKNLKKLIETTLIEGAEKEDIQHMLLTLEGYLDEHSEREELETPSQEEALVEKEATRNLVSDKKQGKASRFNKKTSASERQEILEILMAQFSDLTLFLSEELRKKILISEFVFDFELHIFKLLQKSDLESEEVALILEALQEFSNTRDIEKFRLQLQGKTQQGNAADKEFDDTAHPLESRLS